MVEHLGEAGTEEEPECGSVVMVVVVALLLGGVVHTLPVWIVDHCWLICVKRLLQQSI